ncbi:MAG: aminoglycoside phosphotransferase family protein [Acidimicrobiales bacterium]
MPRAEEPIQQLEPIVEALAGRWSLALGEPFQPRGKTACWVGPARDSAGNDLVLKVCWPHVEAAAEAEGLIAFGGDGAVRLQASQELDGATGLLLERCLPGSALSSRPEQEQDIVIAGLLKQLWRPPPTGHRIRLLEVMCDQWADEYEQSSPEERKVLDPGLAREGIELFRSLPRSAEDRVLLCTDLHAGNVLAAERSPWLAIDPKPHVGDPTYDVIQHMLNCEQRLQADPQGLAQTMATLAGLDPGRVLSWLFARCVQESPRWPGLAEVATRLARGQLAA